MKYIYYIIAILALSSAFIAYQLLGDRPPGKKKAALVVNDRVVSEEEFNKLYSSCDPHLTDKSDFINALISKELLIQEARKLGIDREEPFRQSIQNFYEQSLIKILMDRKFSSISVTVSDEELKRYIGFLNSRLHMTFFSFESAGAAGRGDYRDGEKRIVSFEDLSKELRDALMPLKAGERTVPLKMGEKYIVVRLDRVEELPARKLSLPQTSRVREMLAEEKKERLFNEWLDSLRKNATVIISTDGNK